MFLSLASSALVKFLAKRLITNPRDFKPWNKKAVNSVKAMERRDFMNRLRKIRFAGIPHPIFSRVQLDYKTLANILFARSPRMLQMQSDGLICQLSLDFSAQTVHYLRDVFANCIQEQEPFVLKLELKNGGIIMMHFTPSTMCNNTWVLTSTTVKLDTCVANTVLDRCEVGVRISPNTGVRLITKHSYITLLYSPTINMGLYSDCNFGSPTLVGVQLYCSSDSVIKSNVRKRMLPPTELTVALKRMSIAPNI